MSITGLDIGGRDLDPYVRGLTAAGIRALTATATAIAGVGHYSPEVQPAALLAAMLDWLRSLR